jgi:hypothetical protein
MKRLRTEKPKTNKLIRKFDAPRPGYKRWTTQVKVELLADFYQVAANEDKVLIDALEEALTNWTYHDGDIHE